MSYKITPLQSDLLTSDVIGARRLKTEALIGKGDLTYNAWGVPKTSQAHSIFHGMFTFDIPPRMWTIFENGTKVVNSASTKAYSNGGALFVDAGATLNDDTLVDSRRHPRYQPNRGMLYSSSIGLPNLTALGERWFGLFTAENGMFFKLKSDGNLYACILSDGVLTKEELINIPFDIDLSKGNIYDIQAQWRGVGNIKFFIGNPATGLSTLVHTINNLGTLDQQLSLANPALSVGFYAKNLGDNVRMWCGCVDVTSESGSAQFEQYGSSTKIDIPTSSGGDVVNAIRLPETIKGKLNTRDLRLSKITATCDKKAAYSVYITSDPTAITTANGDADWVSVNSGSYVESVITAEVTGYDTTKMELLTAFPVQAGGIYSVDNPSTETIEFFMIHGDYLIVVGEAPTAVTTSIIEWGEEI